MSETLYTDIRAALMEHLQDMAGVPAIAAENMSFKPDESEPWLEPDIMWGEPFQAEYGTQGTNHQVGVFQIACHFPKGEGVGPLNDMLGKLRERFKRGTELTYNGLTVKVTKAYPTGNILSIPFRCLTPN